MRVVSVIGGGTCDDRISAMARETGRLLAEQGFAVLTGGLSGVMEAASRGAKDGGGITVGVLPGLDRAAANPFVDLPVVTGLSQARNVIVASSGEVVIAVGGGFGTLSEIAIARKHGIPVIGLETWTLEEDRLPNEGMIAVESPAQAVETVAMLLGAGT